jgi:hypothetical protein
LLRAKFSGENFSAHCCYGSQTLCPLDRCCHLSVLRWLFARKRGATTTTKQHVFYSMVPRADRLMLVIARQSW